MVKLAIIKKLKGKALIFEPPQFQGLMEHVHTLWSGKHRQFDLSTQQWKF